MRAQSCKDLSPLVSSNKAQKYVLSFKHVFIPQGSPMHFKLNTCLSALLDQGQSIFSIF